jgi:hypothetical protein
VGLPPYRKVNRALDLLLGVMPIGFAATLFLARKFKRPPPASRGNGLEHPVFNSAITHLKANS